MPTHPTICELDEMPSCKELMSALSKLKKGKAGGRTGIVPELLRHGGAELHDRLLKLVQEVWEEGGDWKDTEIVPIPKKGDIKHCDN